MRKPRSARSRRHRISVLVMAITAIAIVGIGSAAIATAGRSRVATKRVVKTMHNSKLNKKILTRLNGHTLYSLSVETHGNFICTGACTSIWHPLTVPAGTKPTGPVTLGTIKRPEGTTQVKYRGLPLYTFGSDHKPGQVKGQGLKDVGTWHAAVVPKH